MYHIVLNFNLLLTFMLILLKKNDLVKINNLNIRVIFYFFLIKNQYSIDCKSETMLLLLVKI